MNILKVSKSNSNQFISIFILSIFLLHILYLLQNTYPNEFDPKSFSKPFIPIALLIIMTIMSLRVQRFILLFLTLFLFLHITFAIIYELSISGFSFNDKRLILDLLGRSPGATAHAMIALIISIDYFLLNEKKSGHLINIAKLIAIGIIIFTISRVYILFLIIYYFLRNSSFKNPGFYFWYFFIILIALIISYNISFFSETFIRTFQPQGLDSVTSGRYSIWLQFFGDLDFRNTTDLLLGEDLSRHTVYVPASGYLTNDLHNIFLYIMNDYGFIGLAYLLGWYIYVSGVFYIKESYIILISFFIVTLFTSIFVYIYSFYANLLILFIPIYLNNLRLNKANENS